MSKIQAVSGQFDLDAIPRTVQGASGMGDETLWRTRRASVYNTAFDEQGVLSPDGKRLAFVSTRDGGADCQPSDFQ